MSYLRIFYILFDKINKNLIHLNVAKDDFCTAKKIYSHCLTKKGPFNYCLSELDTCIEIVLLGTIIPYTYILSPVTDAPFAKAGLLKLIHQECLL